MHISRARLAPALVLILLGIWFLAIEISPPVRALAYGAQTWPLNVLGAAALLLIVGLLTWTPGLLIPAATVAGVGGLLYWQNATGNWETWSYAWTLIPGFVAIGLLLFGLLSGLRRGALVAAVWLLLVSAVLFGIFGSTLGRLTDLARLWPLALVFFGLLLLVQSVVHRRRPASPRTPAPTAES